MIRVSNPFAVGCRVVLLAKLEGTSKITMGDTGTVVGAVKLTGVVNAHGHRVPELPEVRFDRGGFTLGVTPEILSFVN
jgi:hypothetical protein